MANESIFSSDPIEEETPLDLGLNDLVGDDRKYKTPDELAKAYAHLEGHAKTVERENAEIRARLDAIEATKNNNNNDQGKGREQAPPDDNPPTPPNNQAPPKSENVDFRAQIRDEVKALNEAERAAANIDAAARKMVEVYGDTAKANEAIRRRAGELGVSVEWLQDSASRSPSAFFATMGIQGGASSSTPASGHGANLDRGNTSNSKGFEYYDKIRKDNPKLYYTAAMQREMMNEARRQGSDFYKR